MWWFSNVAWCGLVLLLSASATQMQEPSLSDSHMDILRALSPEAKPASTPGAKPRAPAAVDKPLAVEATAPAAQPKLEKASEAVATKSSASTSGAAPSSKGLSDTQADLLNSLGAHASASSSVSSADAVRAAHEQRDELEMEKEVAELKVGEAQRKAAEQAKEKAAEEAAQHARRQAEEAAKEEEAKKSGEEAKAKAEAEEAKRKAGEAAKKAAEEAKAKAELEAQRKSEAEEANKRQEEAARLAVEEAKRKAEEEAKSDQAEKDRLMEIARVRLIKEQKEKAERDARAKLAAAAREAAAERAEARAAELTEQASKAAEKLKNEEMKRKVAEEDKRLQKLAEEKERREAAESRIQEVKEAAAAQRQEKVSAQASVQAAFQAAIERSKEDARRQKEQKELEAKQASAKAEKGAALKVKRMDDRRQAILKRRQQHKKEQAGKADVHIHWGGKSKEEMERRAKLEAIKKELEEDSAYARAHARREEMREAALKKHQRAEAVEGVDTDNQAKVEAVKEKGRQDAIEKERARRVQEAEELRKKGQAAKAGAAAATANVDDSTAESPMYDNIMVENQTLHAPLGQWGNEQGVIHFMFLIEDTIPHAGVWDHFFKGAGNDESYKIWVHCSGDPENCKDGFSSLPNAVQVESVPSYYCHDLVTAMVQVMRSATKSSQSPQDKFVFVSESTLPVKPFKTVQATLLADQDSDLCIFPQNHWGMTHVDGHGFPEATALRGHTSGATAYLIKHHQWVILNRDHATSMVQKWNAVDSKGHWSVSMHGRTHDVSVNAFTRSEEANYCTDEWAFFATLFGAITVDDTSSGDVNIPGLAGGPLVMKGDKTADVQGRCHTFAFFESAGPYFNKLAGQISQGDSSVSCYPHCWQHPMAISQISSTGLSAIRQSPFLFARKFPSDFKVTPEFYQTILG